MMKKLYLILLVIFVNVSCDLVVKDDKIPPDNFRMIDSEPDWSHDGKFIAYTHLAQNSDEMKNGQSQIRIFNLEDSTVRFLTQGFLPRWSPDDKYIAFQRGNTIFKINLSTRQVTQLTSYEQAYFPSWSPDGKKIVYDSNSLDPRGSNVIWIMNADGSEQKDISVHGTGEWRNPSWSPDGSKILYSRYIDLPAPELFTMDTSGQNQTRITNNSYEDLYPVWSRDGKKIAWNSGYQENYGIWIMDSDGSNKKFIDQNGKYPSWSPDGNEIVYHNSNKDNKGTIWNMNLITGVKQQLVIY